MRFFFKGKHEGIEGRVGNHDRRSVGQWATHIWGFILLIAFASGVGTGIILRADDDSVAEAIQQAAEGDVVRSQVILDSLLSFLARPPQIVEQLVIRDVLIRDTLQVVDTLLVPQEPQIIRVVEIKEVLVIDTVFAPPTIITIPPVKYGFFDSRHFVPNAGNIAYLIVGAALGSVVSSDASACILVSTTGNLERNCEPKQ